MFARQQIGINIIGPIIFLSLALLSAPSLAETINYMYDEGNRLIRVAYEDATAVDFVYDALGNRLTQSTTIAGTPANIAPNQAINPTVPAGATDVSTIPTLSWDINGDPDAGDQVLYSLYLGTPGDMRFINTGSQFSYQPEQLLSLTTYCWQVIARDNHNVINEGPIWCFTTGNEPPEASFTTTLVSVPALREIRFTDTSVSVDDEIVSWEWDFNNDGVIDAYDQYPSFTYSCNGDYKVTLTVTDAAGSQDVATMNISLAEFTEINDIAEDTTWTAENSPYMVTNGLTIPRGITLMIEPGVIVKMGENTVFSVSGTLIAEGLAGNLIYFTSVKDDSVGGDTNGDGYTTSPARGDWRAISFQDAENVNMLNYVAVRHGGDYSGNLNIGYSSLTINHCTIEESSNDGISIYGSLVTIENSTIRNNDSCGISITTSQGTVAENAIENNGAAAISFSESNVEVTDNTMTGNAINAVMVSGDLNMDATWSGGSTVYFIDNGFTIFSSDVTLTIEPGAIIKMGEHASFGVYGALTAEGTADAPIYFTSVKDDSVGGDTNADGGATSPARGDWASIYFQSVNTPSLLDHVVVRHGGDSSGMIYIEDTPLTISNSTIEESGSNGIYCSYAQATISDTLVRNNSDYGFYLQSSDFVLNGNIISDNSDGGLYADGSLYASSSKPEIMGNTISGNSGDGITLQSSNATIANNLISYNVNGINANYSVATITGNIIDNNTGIAILAQNSAGSSITSNAVSGNGVDAVDISGELNIDATWNCTSTVYIVKSSISVGQGYTLTIEPGVIVKLEENVSLDVQGTLSAEGTAAEPIYFTSSKDDSVGGDTNADGSETSPARGDWGAVSFQSGDTSSLLDYVVVRHGGGGMYDGSLYAGSPLTMSHCTIEESIANGIHVGYSQATINACTIQNNGLNGCYFEDSDVTLTNNAITGNGGHGMDISESTTIITESNITGNGGYGIKNTSFSIVVSAGNNYWGDPSGPYDPSDDTGSGGLYNPNGTGAPISDLVDYAPWSELAFAISEPCAYAHDSNVDGDVDGEDLKSYILNGLDDLSIFASEFGGNDCR